MSNKINVVDLISKAFPVEPIPKEIFIGPPSMQGDRGDIGDSLAEELQGKSWNIVSLNNWLCTAYPSVIMGMITPAAFHYYLPSLLIGTIEDFGYFDRGASALLPNNKLHVRKSAWWFEYESLFNPAQVKAVIAFLEYIETSANELDESKYLAKDAILLWKSNQK